MMRNYVRRAVLALAALALVSSTAWAQGGGASSTGTIQGRIGDTSGAVLPGVTVTASSPALIGVQTSVSSENGNYRFPAVPPGTYTLVYELAGFNTLRREGIQISLGFTANVNVDLALATLQETVTVVGESPVIDTTATRVVQNFKLDQLQSIPNGRDMWSLLAVTPSVQMTRIDVGGNRAGTQTGYTAYGFSGQVRVLVEGINSTEGTGAAGFYFDYSSLEEVFLGTSGQTAEMPNPGVQSQFIAKSGGNQLAGEYYLDWYNNSLQGVNIPADVIARGIRPHSNEIDRYYDTAVHVGGPIRKDRIWWFGSFRTQFNAVAQPNFLFDQTFDTKLWNPVGKLTYKASTSHKFIGYYQWGQKAQPNRLPFASYSYTDASQTVGQNSGSWVWKGEWNGTLSDRMYVEARFGDFGYFFPMLSNSNDSYFWRDTGLEVLTGSHQKWQIDRDRKQLTSAATYFVDTGKGSHTIKAGGEMLLESGFEGYEQRWGGNIEHVYTNGVSNQVSFGFPTSTGELGSKGARADLLSLSKLDVLGLFANDTWTFGRATMNLGVRFDRYTNSTPEQKQLGGTVGPVTIQDATFPEKDYFTWTSFAPRLGFIYDLSGDGKTVLKANYGLYWHNPGVNVASSASPNQASKTATYAWSDTNGDRRYQLGEERTLLSTALAGAVSHDPDIKQPYTHEASFWLERQVTDTIGVRAGFVYKTEDDLWQTYRPGRPPSAHSVAFPFTDIGADGVRGTSDDKVLTLYGMPSSQAASFPVSAVVMTVPRTARYKTIEAAMNKRYGDKWSASIGGSYTLLNDFPEGSYPNTPNEPFAEDRTTWNLKATGSYDAPYGIRISPVLRHQSGTNFARTISVPASAASAFGLVYSGTIYAEPADSNREDDIWVFDVRAEKTIEVGARVRLRTFVDLFNLTNSAASETITRSTGANYLRPAAILAPRTARVGFRLIW